MDTSRACLVGLGEALWDVIEGERHLGGAPLNFAVQAARCGARAELVSCVGDDDSGREILAELDTRGVGREGVCVSRDRPTGMVDVFRRPDATQDYEIHRNAAWDEIPWSDALERIAREADAVCFGSLCQRSPVSRETIHRFLASTRPDCRTVFDVNLRKSGPGKDVITASLAAANALKMSDEEAPVLAGLFGAPHGDAGFIELLASTFGLDLVALTLGRKGCLVWTPGGVAEHPGFEVEIPGRHTVGAGDAFTAAMTLAWLEGASPDEIALRANRAAADVLAGR